MPTPNMFSTVIKANSIVTASWLKEPGTYLMTLQSVKETTTATSGTPCLRVTYLTSDKKQMVTDSVLFSDNGIIGIEKYLQAANIDLNNLGDTEIDLFDVVNNLKGREFQVVTERIDDGRVVVRGLRQPQARNLKAVVRTNAIQPSDAKDAG